MAKGIFTQGVCLLTNGQTVIKHIESALQEHSFEIVKQTPAQENQWVSGPGFVVAFASDVNGYAAVDVVDQPWPDAMGDPKSDPMIFCAWSMGFFGPLTFPGGLARAQQHAWAWGPARNIPEGHLGFIRIQMTYALGKKDGPILPEDYDPLVEMMFLSRIVLALFEVPGVICYFNPNGEVLRDHKRFRELWENCLRQNNIPLSLWMNIRFFNLNEKLGFMDKVGNGQLDIRDVEAIFPHATYDPGNVDNYMRNVTLYLIDLDREMRTGEDIDGPGESNLSWILEVLDKGVIEPPRRVLRLYPKADHEAVQQALAALGH